MKNIFTVFAVLITCAVFSQDENNNSTSFKNDIAISYSGELSQFYRGIPALTYRREIHEKWMLKVSIMGSRRISETNHIGSFSFALSDTSLIRRNQFTNFRMNKSIKLGVDFIDLKSFNLGSQLVLGKAQGWNYIRDKAFYSKFISPDYEALIYSEELTQNYHPYQSPAAGTIETGRKTESLGGTAYNVIGLNLSAEAKWPIRKRFEIALQYTPEALYYIEKKSVINFETDSYFDSNFENFFDFNQFASLLFRVKF